ncbi:hypothetical protein B0H34DRAFT_859413 [Crassisporium funariophilum]|nr:hypothetical protein B0H34DRAFT_859413 [Crassisporium funariophilum]
MANRKKTGKEAAPAAAPAPAPLPPSDAEEKKPQAKAIKWEDHPDWTTRAIQHLVDHPKFRICLFSDSTGDAKDEKRKKIQASEGKSILYGQLAKIVKDMGNPHSSSFTGEPALLTFEQRIQVNVLIRLKKIYQAYCKQFQVTGGGVKEDEDAENLTDKIQSEWPFYKDLHKMWSELPNYNPIGITTSNPGQDFAGNAEALFAKKSGETNTSSGIEDNTLSTYNNEYEGDADDDGGLDDSSKRHLDLLDAEGVDEKPDNSEIKKLEKKNKQILKAQEEKKLALEKTCANEKTKAGKTSKKCDASNDNLDELHLLEMKDIAAQRAEKT